jgi:hypothetical protein
MSLHRRLHNLEGKLYGAGCCSRCGRERGSPDRPTIVQEVIVISESSSLPAGARPWQEPPKCPACGLWKGPVPILYEDSDGKLYDDGYPRWDQRAETAERERDRPDTTTARKR